MREDFNVFHRVCGEDETTVACLVFQLDVHGGQHRAVAGVPLAAGDDGDQDDPSTDPDVRTFSHLASIPRDHAGSHRVGDVLGCLAADLTTAGHGGPLGRCGCGDRA